MQNVEINNLQISGHTVSYEWEQWKCELILKSPEYWSVLRMLEAESREFHESKAVGYTQERENEINGY